MDGVVIELGRLKDQNITCSILVNFRYLPITALCKNNGTRIARVHLKKLRENSKNIMSCLRSELCSSGNCYEDWRIRARPHGTADSKRLRECVKFASL